MHLLATRWFYGEWIYCGAQARVTDPRDVTRAAFLGFYSRIGDTLGEALDTCGLATECITDALLFVFGERRCTLLECPKPETGNTRQARQRYLGQP